MKNKNPFWYNLINTFKNEQIIVNGLTIPFIIGAYQFTNVNIGTGVLSVQNLLSEIISSRTELKPVLQHCPDIHEFVIGLKSKGFCKKNFEKDFTFKNEFGESTLIITHNAITLGTSIESISNSLFPKYAKYLQTEEFSWSGYEQVWRKFNNMENELINTLEI